jgi:uncharacterized peroxidase-related enzyme
VLDGISGNGKRVINIFKAMANSSATLKMFFAMLKSLEEKSLSNENAERIALLLSQINGCEYCESAHAYSASKILTEEEVKNALDGRSQDQKSQAVLDFANAVMKKAGKVSDTEFDAAKNAGISDSEIMDIVSVVALNFFTNAVNNVAQTKVDFPKYKK